VHELSGSRLATRALKTVTSRKRVPGSLLDLVEQPHPEAVVGRLGEADKCAGLDRRRICEHVPDELIAPRSRLDLDEQTVAVAQEARRPPDPRLGHEVRAEPERVGVVADRFEAHEQSKNTSEAVYKCIAWDLGLPTERSRAALYRVIRAEVTRLCLDAKVQPMLVVDEAQTKSCPQAWLQRGLSSSSATTFFA